MWPRFSNIFLVVSHLFHLFLCVCMVLMGLVKILVVAGGCWMRTWRGNDGMSASSVKIWVNRITIDETLCLPTQKLLKMLLLCVGPVWQKKTHEKKANILALHFSFTLRWLIASEISDVYTNLTKETIKKGCTTQNTHCWKVNTWCIQFIHTSLVVGAAHHSRRDTKVIRQKSVLSAFYYAMWWVYGC